MAMSDLPGHVRRSSSLNNRGPQIDGTLACLDEPIRQVLLGGMLVAPSDSPRKPPRAIGDKLARQKIWLC